MKKYIGQLNSDNFIYPNNTLYEYDVDIIHEINNNGVSGDVTNFDLAKSGPNINVTFDYVWNKNGAEPFIDSSSNLHLFSVHMMSDSQKYFKPWMCVGSKTTTGTTQTTVSGAFAVSVTPAMVGVSSFGNGNYYFEIRFIGHRGIDPVLISEPFNVSTPTPTPTPTSTTGAPAASPTPTASPTSSPLAPGATRTPTPTPSYTPTSTPLTPTYSFKLGTGVTSTAACIDYDPATNNNYYSYDSALDNGTELYSIGDYPLSGTPPDGYYSNGTTVWYLVSGILVGGTMCTFTPTPTPTPTTLGVGYGINTGTTFANSTLACAAALYPGPTIYLTAGDTVPTVGDFFYLDQYTTPGNTFVGNGNYYCVRKGGTLYAIQINSYGGINAVTTC